MSREERSDRIAQCEAEAIGYLNVKARKSLAHFTLATFPNFDFSWHHKLICRYLERWIRGELPYLIIEAPPRHGKSQLASIQTPAFIHGLNPNAQIVGASYAASMASKNNRDVQRIIGSEEYANIFPETRLSDANNRTMERALRNSDEYEIVGHRGYYKAVGIGGGLTGRGANYMIIDDPIKDRAEADSKTIRDNIWDWWSSVAFTRLEKEARVLIMNTRWHEDDLCGRLIDQTKKGDEDALPWFRLRLPAVYEPGTDENPVMREDPRNIGDPLWANKFDRKRLQVIKATTTSRDWNALYQQRPSVEEGGIISKSWIKFYGGRGQPEMPSRFTRQIISADLNFKEGVSNDFVAIQVWGEFNANYYLLAQFRRRVGFVDTLDAFRDLIKTWPKAVGKYIEEKANGAAIIDMMKKGDPKNGIPGISGLVPINPTESKEARLMATEPLWRSGNVWFPDPAIAPWIKDNIDELVKFPNTAHDDTVDATSQALNQLVLNRSDLLSRMTRM